MPRAPARFRQADVTRAVKAAQNAGLTVGRLEVDLANGKVVIVAKEEAAAVATAAPSLAEWRARRGKG